MYYYLITENTIEEKIFDVSEWKDEILKAEPLDRKELYNRNQEKILKYDIRKNVKQLEDFYSNALIEKKK